MRELKLNENTELIDHLKTLIES